MKIDWDLLGKIYSPATWFLMTAEKPTRQASLDIGTNLWWVKRTDIAILNMREIFTNHCLLSFIDWLTNEVMKVSICCYDWSLVISEKKTNIIHINPPVNPYWLLWYWLQWKNFMAWRQLVSMAVVLWAVNSYDDKLRLQ